MNTTAPHRLRPSFVVAFLALMAACSGDATVAPNRLTVPSNVAAFSKTPDLGVCQKLQAPAGSKLAFHAFADGVQIYRWTGTSWGFVAPSATLSADAAGNGQVGTHYAGPTWESNSGSKVVGTVIDRCTPDASAIPWLSLAAVSAEGPGVFHRIIFIQRVNTVGGMAPSASGSVIGEEARVPYTAEYFFYRAH
ncbi:MAG TPA: DUF3455 domain-containing protein [Gemmatimonadaceae bacterium]